MAVTNDNTPWEVTVDDHLGHSHNVEQVAISKPIKGLFFDITAQRLGATV